MKTALTYWFAMLLILLVASFAMIGCKTKQNTQTTTAETKDKTTISDGKETVTINREILDQMFYNIANIKSSDPDCDSLINHYRQELARSIAASKQSGDNSYEIKYNDALMRLEILMKIGQTENKVKTINKYTKTTYTLQETIEVPVHFMHWWEKAFMRTGQVLSVALVGYLLLKFKRA